jgi:hypothetical protein
LPIESLNNLDPKFSTRDKDIENAVQKLEQSLTISNLDMAISATEIIKATCISQLKNNKACGLDLITNEMMKASANRCNRYPSVI